MPSIIRQIFSRVWIIYKYLSFLVGTTVVLSIAIILVHQCFQLDYNNFEIPLQSGFTYSYEVIDGKYENHFIKNKNGRVVVLSDVESFMEEGYIIYGMRKNLEDSSVYFICEYGENCNSAQNLGEKEFQDALKKRSVRPFSSKYAIRAFELEKEVERHNYNNGRDSKIKWVFDKETFSYKAH